MAELDGRPVTLDELKALALVNYGHFTTMRVENGAVRGLSLHLERLTRDCRELFDAPLDPDLVRHLLRRALAGTPGPVVARVTVFDPDLDLGHPAAKAQPRVLVTLRPAPSGPLPPIRVRPVPYRREAHAVKHVGLFDLLRLRRAAQLAGYDDAVFTDAHGQLSEGATWNLGFFDGTQVIWPHADQLPGVTMALLHQAHPDHRIEPISLPQLPTLQAAFATNAAIGIRPITAIGPTTFLPTHPILTQLATEYTAIPADPL
ncbi:branched-subunit amino acid aminotransferase/4-amino-4-deoxychorismate lyase [Kitasatospora sp. MAP12-15]|uniref:aminotransferase class IV family protein n=1 Tax=unclassified Kitasatospora TaxID=2633591 RepID=UPI002474DCC5|nr:aminotransferase class IV family protein [Kitasatospora sp. MAP12-44]MDH6110362.1 branched-subunit amino acid aminotransferase/4-amino-4-deoxychorismate lyase [Kitasatospora sp. MAP12-44]